MDTTRITIKLTDANNGTWETEDGEELATGHKLTNDAWDLAKSLSPIVNDWMLWLGETDALVYAVDGNGDDVCQFRWLNGEFQAQV